MSYALIDTFNVLLIGVIVAVGVMLPAAQAGGSYARIATLLVFGDWLGVLVLAVVSLLIFDGIGDAIATFVDSPLFGILLLATAAVIAVMSWRGGGDSSAMVQRLLGPLRTPTPATLGTGFVLGIVQSATSGPFFAGILVMSAGDFSVITRYVGMVGYAAVALSLPLITAIGVGYVRVHPDSWLGERFERMRDNSSTIAKAGGYIAAILLAALGAVHFL